jgi:hypothetical protein
MKAKVNPFYRSVVLSVGDVELSEIFFDYTDEWESREIKGKMYDIHFNYQPKDSYKNEKEWLMSLVSVHLVGDWTEEHYSRNLITEVKLEL